VNDNTATPHSSSRLRKRLRAVGVIVLLLGLGAASAVYWTGSRAPEGMDGMDDRLLAGPSRAERHQVGLLYGTFGLRVIDMMNGLKDPGAQAVIIAAVSIVIALGCFYIARVSDPDDDTHRRMRQ
jgi:hypothetical protein